MATAVSVALVPVPFYDDTLLVYRDPHTEQCYVAPKPMVACFELDWRSQYRKLLGNPLYKEGIIIMTIPTDGGPQQGLLLETRLVPTWLLSINSKRLRPALRDKLLRYQRACADALDAYFTQGVAVNLAFAGAPAVPPPRYGVLDHTLQQQLVAAQRELIAMQQHLITLLAAGGR